MHSKFKDVTFHVDMQGKDEQLVTAPQTCQNVTLYTRNVTTKFWCCLKFNQIGIHFLSTHEIREN